MEQKDSRIKLVNEILNGIKVIKLYAWEHPFNQLVMGIRGTELGILRKYAFLRAGFAFTWTCAPFMVRCVDAWIACLSGGTCDMFITYTYMWYYFVLQVTVVTFLTYALVHLHSTDPDEQLTASKVFVALSLFNILRFPLIMLPMIISFLIEVRGRPGVGLTACGRQLRPRPLSLLTRIVSGLCSTPAQWLGMNRGNGCSVARNEQREWLLSS